MANMSTPGKLVAFIATRNIDRAERFYVDVLGMTLVGKNPHAVVLDNDGAELRVTLVGEKARAQYTVLGWEVTDLSAEVATLRGRRVTFKRYPGMTQDADDAWTAPDGTRVCWFEDPDGNVLSLHQN
jgi:catechol 2,3-dioxygenase-like lactoylglutathione lyase family enzyme